MKISTFRVFALDVRRNSILAAVVSLAPLLGGCVSAVDDSTAFGFNGNASTANAAGTKNAAGAKADGEDASSAAAADDSAPTEGAPTVATAEAEPSTDIPDTATAQADTKPDGAEADKTAEAGATGGDSIASGRATIAAYAGATVGPSSETDQPQTADGAPRKANSTLFASLFAESQAKTPVRNAESGKSRRVILKPEGAPVDAARTEIMASLPGVKSRASLFEIGQKASADYDAEILEEANGDEGGSYEVASLSGMARLAPNGLLVQRPDVETSCFEPKLVSMLRAVETRFHTKVVVTSGYRSPTHNRLVNGARRSMHMACKAADIQVPGANNIEVANFVRSLPGRGGVGTYCHTTAVHVDIGRERDWNWACRRRRT